MRKKCAATRGFPFEVIAQTLGIDGEQLEPLLALEMLGCGDRDLICGREVDISIGNVDRGAIGFALCDQSLVLVRPEDFVST